MSNWLSKLYAVVKPAPTGKAVGSKLPVVAVPKVKSGQASIPSYFKTAKPDSSMLLARADRGLASLDIETYRVGVDSRQVVRDFAAASPDLSAAVNAYLRTAITSHYVATAHNTDGTFNREATALVQQLLTRFDSIGDYTDGFSGINTLRSTSESLAKEIMINGACALELVLGKDRLPRALVPLAASLIFFYPDKSGKFLRPVQKLGGEEIDLDIPTFFYASLDQDLLNPYASSPLESALQPALFGTEFMNDLRRVVKRVVHPRLTVKISEEALRKNIDPAVAADPAKLRAFLDSVIEQAKSMIDGLKPEEALVFYDSIEFSLLNNGNITLNKEWEVLNDMVDAKMATGAKALPSILGHGSGTSNASSTDALLFMKNADGIVREKLNEIYSRALTLAVRLFGLDVYVNFSYDGIDLRPKAELEAFNVMRQSRILELLSIGFITDDEASMQLTGQLTPVGFKPRSGTDFMTPVKADPNQNPYNGSGAGGGKGGGGAGQQKNNEPPKQSKGPQKKAEDETPPLTAGDVADAVIARLPAPAPAALEALVAEPLDLAPLKDGIVAEIYDIAGAIDRDAIAREERAQASAAETTEAIRALSEKVDAISNTSAPAEGAA